MLQIGHVHIIQLDKDCVTTGTRDELNRRFCSRYKINDFIFVGLF